MKTCKCQNAQLLYVVVTLLLLLLPILIIKVNCNLYLHLEIQCPISLLFLNWSYCSIDSFNFKHFMSIEMHVMFEHCTFSMSKLDCMIIRRLHALQASLFSVCLHRSPALWSLITLVCVSSWLSPPALPSLPSFPLSVSRRKSESHAIIIPMCLQLSSPWLQQVWGRGFKLIIRIPI